MTRLWLVLLLLIWGTLSAYADGDIVYAARYYLPPGSKGTSHFHLYRINPDGTGRRQITFGLYDDNDPHWSADGTWILFTRYDSPPDGPDTNPRLCYVSTDGAPVINVMSLLKMGKLDESERDDVHWLPHGHTISIVHTVSKGKSCITFSSVYLIDAQTKKSRRFPGLSSFDSSSDGKYALTTSDQGNAIYNLNRGTFIPIPNIDQSAVWLDNQTFAALIPVTKRSDDKYNIVIFGLDGRKRNQLPYIIDSDQVLFPSLLAAPKPLMLIYSYNAASPSWADNLYFSVDLKTGKMRYLTHGQFLAFAPNGRRFCTAPQRNTTPYAKRRYQLSGFELSDPGRKYQMVYNSPLYLHDIKTERMHQITSRLSWVTAADWRKAGQ